MGGLGPHQAMVLAFKCLVEGEQLQTLHGRYVGLVAAWLLHLAAQPAPAEAFARLPESAATNACALVRHTARTLRSTGRMPARVPL